MTTPNQSNDDRNQTNGVTERVASSPIQPRPIPRQGAAEGAKAPESGGAGDESFDQATVRMGTESNGPANGSGNGKGKSPYQDGWAQLPQREPQSNLYRPGEAPSQGRPSSGGQGGGGLKGSGPSNARTTADLAAKAARKEAAMVKSVGIDGPTRSIARPELVKDMPDLSDVRHPGSDLPMANTGLPMAPQQPQSGPSARAAAASGPVSPAVPVAIAAAASGEPLRATVQIRRIDPWSTLKITLVISVALFFVWMVAVGLLYIVLAGMGVWDNLDNSLGEMFNQEGSSGGLIDAGTIFGYAGVIGLINVVLFTALATVGVFIYNQCCDLVGGIQVTLADPD
ncbi:DUF3566 domain-containing protein [Nocardia coubleae]|uniref:DUF3566 domain-containing protein n=1 Tax=Nocardia coubleae TaxID=356147 RepID=A0A846W281_9NOCA|nr:DUF3566 domain-containing protein [Nocardia coubleae]NKX87251.1 DUF3566 domain-containing protein [Nocardia coubleae]